MNMKFFNEQPRKLAIDNTKITPELEENILHQFEQFGIQSNEEYFIFQTQDGRKHFIHKWNEIPLRESDGEIKRMKIRDYIQYFIDEHYN